MNVLNRWQRRPFAVRKLEQLVRIVRESHEQPLIGEPVAPKLAGPGELAITFIGHSSFLLQLGGKNILIDPVFATRLVVLRRQRRAGVRIPDLPPIDVVLITHAHMDHLNLPSLRAVVRAMRRQGKPAPAVVVPVGVDDLVRRIGFSRIDTVTWWQERIVCGLRLTMTPCKHWGARMFNDTHREFGGYVLQPEHGGPIVYHSGDTAYFAGFREIGKRLTPDIALLPVGAYFPDSHRAVHTSPEEAVRGFIETKARWMVPMHYGTFRLGREPIDEPLQRLAAESRRLGLGDRVRVVAEGETWKLREVDISEPVAALAASNHP